MSITLTALLAISSAAPAQAATPPDCTPWRDETGLLAIGRFPLGTPFDVLDAGLTRLPDCFISADRQAIDCEFVDDDGIAYLADAQGLVRVEARSGEADNGSLPLGLEFGNSKEEVSRRLRAMLPVQSPVGQLLSQVDKPAWASGNCVVHQGSEGGSFYVEFHGVRGLSRVGLGWHAN
ncbi:MAG: hypothetical protein ACXIUZ_06165 [Lysobacteraceae bacterium]